MILDTDSHISPYKTAANEITVGELLRPSDRAKAEKAVTWLR